MRRAAVVLAMLGLMATTAVPSQAGHLGSHNVTFTAAIPCATACPYWIDTANTDVDGDGKDDVFFNECAAPEPYQEGVTYDDILSPKIPSGADLVILEIFPLADFDSFICEYKDTWDGDGNHGETLAQGANILGENCDNVIGPQNPVPFGCREKAQINAKAGKQVIFRVYNWSDIPSTPGRYTFKNV